MQIEIEELDEKIAVSPDSPDPAHRYLLPYFFTNTELSIQGRATPAVKDVVREFLWSPLGVSHQRCSTFSENLWSDRLTFGLDHIYKDRFNFLFCGRWTSDPWIQFLNLNEVNDWFIFNGTPDFLVTERDVVIVDSQDSGEDDQDSGEVEGRQQDVLAFEGEKKVA